MTDSNDDDKRGRSRGGSDRARTGGPRSRTGDRPARGAGKAPFRARDGEDRPRRPRPDGERPVRSRDGDVRPRGERPVRSRDGDERPRSERPVRSREGGDRPRGDRPFRSREGDDRPRGERPFRSREGGDRPRQTRSEGERPSRSRPGTDRPPRAADARPQRAAPDAAAPAEAPEPAEDRIAKVIARAGVASRRDVEAMIAEGRVTLNGEVLTSPAINVTAQDRIEVDGEPLPTKERTRLWIFHKPRGLVTTARDPEGRPTVFESLPEDMPRVVAVGRLDINTEGLLLLTNDGGLAKVIAHPDTGWLRRYRVRAHGEINQADLDRLRDGVTVDEMEYGPVEARIDRVQGDNVWITLGLREGKNREVKRILEHLGLQVNRLIRLSFGPFQLGDLETGLVEEVRTKVLKDQLGDKLAQEAGVDFTSPVREPIAPFGSPEKKAEQRARDLAGRPRRARDERPDRGDQDGERPFRSRDERPARGRRDDEARPFRSRDERPARGRRDEEAPPARPSRLEPKRSVWRAGEEEAEPRTARKVPRRGSDPKEARTASAERPRERMATIQAGEGRKVLVERLVSEPREEAPARPARGSRAPAGDDRPRRPSAGGERRNARPAREGDERAPRRPRAEGDRPFRARDGEERTPRRPRIEGDRPTRSRDGDRPFRGGDRSRGEDRPFRGDDDRPRRGPPRGDAPPRGGAKAGFKPGFKGGDRGPPRGGSKGGFAGGGKGAPRGGPASRGGSKGGPKGPPRGRRS